VVNLFQDENSFIPDRALGSCVCIITVSWWISCRAGCFSHIRY